MWNIYNTYDYNDNDNVIDDVSEDIKFIINIITISCFLLIIYSLFWFVKGSRGPIFNDKRTI